MKLSSWHTKYRIAHYPSGEYYKYQLQVWRIWRPYWETIEHGTNYDVLSDVAEKHSKPCIIKL
jgi:hypothetical protein